MHNERTLRRLALKSDVSIGRTLLNLNRIMLGLAPAAGLYHRPVDTNNVRQMISRAVGDFHITELDTAPWYGCGKSEIDLGAALNETRDSRPLYETARVFTKVGRIAVPRHLSPAGFDRDAIGTGLDEAEFMRRHAFALTQDTCYALAEETKDFVCIHDCTYQGIMTSFHQSLTRLNGVPIFGIRLHDADTDALFKEATEQGGLDAMRELKKSGRVKQIGLGLNMDVAQKYIELAAQQGQENGKEEGAVQFDSVMIAGCWNLLNQSGAQLLMLCQELGIEIHLAGVFGAGFLHGQSKYLYAEAGSDLFTRRDAWMKLCAAHDVTLQQLALAFAFRPQCVAYVAIGCSMMSELESNVTLVRDSESIPMEKLEKILAEAVANSDIGFDRSVYFLMFPPSSQ